MNDSFETVARIAILTSLCVALWAMAVVGFAWAYAIIKSV
jgi:hypothetical protein